MNEQNIRSQGVGFNSPLNEMDTETEIFGCRANK